MGILSHGPCQSSCLEGMCRLSMHSFNANHMCATTLYRLIANANT